MICFFLQPPRDWTVMGVVATFQILLFLFFLVLSRRSFQMRYWLWFIFFFFDLKTGAFMITLLQKWMTKLADNLRNR